MTPVGKPALPICSSNTGRHAQYVMPDSQKIAAKVWRLPK
jgi:hypothetical protein